ncbi:hypothetical protein ACSSS7_007350 [Eimeria intestinalis]
MARWGGSARGDRGPRREGGRPRRWRQRRRRYRKGPLQCHPAVAAGGRGAEDDVEDAGAHAAGQRLNEAAPARAKQARGRGVRAECEEGGRRRG